MNFCPTCGRSLEGAVRFCFGCGTDLAAAVTHGAAPAGGVQSPPAQPAAPQPTAAYVSPAAPTLAAGYAPGAVPASNAPGQMAWQSRATGRFAMAPPELLAVCALMAIAGGLTLWPVIRVLPDIFDLFGDGEFGRDLGLLLLTVWVVLGLFGVACLLLAWRLGHADRVARGLTHVLLGGLGASILIGDVHDWQLIVVMLVGFGSMAVLAFAPRVQAYFTGPAARQYDAVASIVTARVLVAVWASIMVVVGAMFLPLSDIGQKFLVVGVFLVALGVGGFILNRRLDQADPLARILVSAGAAVYIILLLVVDRRDPGMILPLSLGAGVVYFLWFPAESREFFAAGSVSRPLPAWMQSITAPAGSAATPHVSAEPAPVYTPPSVAMPSVPVSQPVAYPPTDPGTVMPPAAGGPIAPTQSFWRDPIQPGQPTAAAQPSVPAQVETPVAPAPQACRQPSCVARDVPTVDKFCGECGHPTA